MKLNGTNIDCLDNFYTIRWYCFCHVYVLFCAVSLIEPPNWKCTLIFCFELYNAFVTNMQYTLHSQSLLFHCVSNVIYPEFTCLNIQFTRYLQLKLKQIRHAFTNWLMHLHFRSNHAVFQYVSLSMHLTLNYLYDLFLESNS